MCSLKLKLQLPILVLAVLDIVSTSKILFISTIPSVSHQKAFQPIWKELSLRGHTVHVVTSNPLRNPTLTNLTEYDVSFLFKLADEALSRETKQYLLKNPSFLDMFKRYSLLTDLASSLNEKALKHEQMQRLLQNNMAFDVVIAEWLFPTSGAIAAKYGCPLIGISSLGASMTVLDAIGNPSHPIANPEQNLPITRDMSFRERLLSVTYSVYVRVFYHLIVLPREDQVIKKYIGENLPRISDIERNVTLLLLNKNPVFHKVMPVVPTIIEFGGIGVNRSKPKLDTKLQDFLDKSNQGAIYFSFGSSLHSILIQKNVIDVLLNVFRKLPYNIVFKWENNTLPGQPNNVFISKWLPQFTVLDHPNTKLFLTQGGLQSCEEAILAEVPIIGFPGPADQTANVDTFVKYGAGIALDMGSLIIEQLNSSIYEIMTNSSYKQNIRTLSILMRDQPTDGIQKAIWWIEYVIRHKGAKHLRSLILDIPWWQYFMLDIIGALSVILVLLVSMFNFIWMMLYLLLKKIVAWKIKSGMEFKKRQ